MLEDDIINTSQYVHFHKDNLDTFSLKLYTQLFLSANIFERCITHIRNTKRGNFGTWKKDSRITNKYKRTITIIQMDYSFQPLLNFGEKNIKDRKLEWWSAYNHVKHSLTNLNEATLKNVLHAAASAGILVTDSCLHTSGGCEVSKLFREVHIPTYYE